MDAVDRIATARDKPLAEALRILALGPVGQVHYPASMRNSAGDFSGERQIVEMNWRLVGNWHRDGKKTSRLAFNARRESIAEALQPGDKCSMFIAPFKSRRRLLPATSYEEYRSENGKKIPYKFLDHGGLPYAYAGLWEAWYENEKVLMVDDFPRLLCSMITCEPNPVASQYHDRMPAILDRTDFARWIDPSSSFEELLELLVPLHDDRLTVCPWPTPPDPRYSNRLFSYSLGFIKAAKSMLTKDRSIT